MDAVGLTAIDRTGTTQVKFRFSANQTGTSYIVVETGANAKLIVEYRK